MIKLIRHCEECGSTENVQGHHRISGDDSSIVDLCGECHANKHPDVPKRLITCSKSHPPKMPIEEKFFSKIRKGQKPDDCWIWLDKIKNRDAMTGFRYIDRVFSIRRLSWQLANGAIPAGHFIYRNCETPGCVNPLHLTMSRLFPSQRPGVGAKISSTKSGVPGIMQAVEPRFYSRITKGEGDKCWIWNRAIDGREYGVLVVKGNPRKAHRISWELNNGPVPEGMVVCHRCDNKRCVRPDHLFLGTQRDNILDCLNKGRRVMPSGENNCASKLTGNQVREIIQKIEHGEGACKLAREYGVTIGAIYPIKKGRTWKNIRVVT